MQHYHEVCTPCVCIELKTFPIVCFVDSVEEDKMLAEGVSRFCDDANLDPTSLTVLILAWKFKAATQCEFSRKEFVEGMAELG